MTSRWLINFINQLPDGSRTQTARIEAKPHERWDAINYQVADLTDFVRHLIAVTAYHGSGKKPPEIKPMPRPTDVLVEREKPYRLAESNLAMVQAMFGSAALEQQTEPEEEPWQATPAPSTSTSRSEV